MVLCDRQTNRQTDSQTDRRADRLSDRQADKQSGVRLCLGQRVVVVASDYWQLLYWWLLQATSYRCITCLVLQLIFRVTAYFMIQYFSVCAVAHSLLLVHRFTYTLLLCVGIPTILLLPSNYLQLPSYHLVDFPRVVSRGLATCAATLSYLYVQQHVLYHVGLAANFGLAVLFATYHVTLHSRHALGAGAERALGWQEHYFRRRILCTRGILSFGLFAYFYTYRGDF